MSMIQSDLLLGQEGGAGHVVQRSLRFSSIDSAYCSRVPSTAGNRTTWTWAGWVKRSALSNALNYTLFSSTTDSYDLSYNQIQFEAGNKIRLKFADGGTTTLDLTTNAVFRDASAWYHILIAVDTTQSAQQSRVSIYINGALQALTGTYPGQNANTIFNKASASHHLAGIPPFSEYFSGLLADVFFIDGQALTPSSFVETSATTGQLIPKAYTGTFGTNGFWLKFSDNSAATATTLGKDYSNNSNNWTPYNLSVTAGAGNDSLVDTPTSYGTDTGAGGEVRGNYATWNPLRNDQGATLSNGNLDLSTAGSTSRTGTYATIGVTTGKWYWEITAGSLSTDGYNVGIASSIKGLTDPLGSTAESYIYINGGTKRNNNTTTSYGATYTAGDVIGVALDLNAGSLTFYKNGASQGTAFTGIPVRDWFPIVADDATASTSGASFIANFGQRQWAYAAPAGFKALCDTNLPAPVVAKPSSAFDVKLITANNSTQAITGLSFSPDLVWTKSRSQALSHYLYDTVRGAQKLLISNATNAESTITDSLISFDAGGFTLGANDGANYGSGSSVAWCFDAGSTTTTNTAGSITSQCRTSVSSGFSVITYTGTGAAGTVGHGLGVAPSFFVVKSRSAAGEWVVYHQALGRSAFLQLQDTAASVGISNYWGTADPTSTVFSLNSYGGNNFSGRTYVCYAWAPVAGYSSFGSYTGNGSASGPFIYTGHRPRFLIIKRTDSDNVGTAYWFMYDTARSPYNTTTAWLAANLSNAEATTSTLDILSNGFYWRDSGGSVNANGRTYIWASFAESPFQYARAR